MADRSVSISPRKEETREKNDIIYTAIQFQLDEIKQHFYSSLTDIQNQISIAESLSKDGKTDEAKDILRAQVVYVEGIMDFYLHELSKYALVKMFTGEWNKSESYSNFQIPMSTVEEGLKNPESTEWLFERLNSRFGLEVYLSPDTIGKQLSLIGMKLDDICKKAVPKVKGRSYITGQQRLKDLYARRNQIAHQVDRKHSTAEKEDIDRAFVEEAIDFVTRFVEAVHVEALSKEE